MHGGFVSPSPPSVVRVSAGVSSSSRPGPRGLDSANPTSNDAPCTDSTEPSGLWPTPMARLGDAKRGIPSPALAQRRWDSGRRNLDDAVALWPTPLAKDYRSGRFENPDRKAARNGGATLSETVARIEHSTGVGTLNPTWLEWLQGLPIGWTEPGPSETA